MSDTAIIVLVVILTLITLYIVGIYNELVTLRNRFKNAFAQIEVQLKRRHDLIPSLVETAKGYLSHERETLEAVTTARNAAVYSLKAAAAEPGSAQAIAQLGKTEGLLNSAMDNLNVSFEDYPDLYASEIMLQLSEEISSTENRTAFSRQFFNDSVMNYNIYKQQFPTVWLANLFGHGADASLLEFADSEQIQTPPQVSFS